MIEIKNLSKSFDDIKAVDDISLSIKDGTVFGLIGTNGAGKSTFLRMMSGILKPDRGEVLIDGQSVYENIEAKKLFFYISDEQHFFANSTPYEMMKYYRGIYENFDSSMFDDMMEKFGLSKDRKISTFSKGMKKQLSVIYGMCARTKYLFCDETFDGLDPVMRQGVKSLFAMQMGDRDFTPVIASHNLRELEDICDHVGLLHKGGVLLSKDLEEMKDSIHRIQFVLKNPEEETQITEKLDIMNIDHRGSLTTITARGEREEITGIISVHEPVFMEALPLSLEEIFISETGVVGYDIKKLIY